MDNLDKITTFFEAENHYFQAQADERDVGSLLHLLDPEIVVQVPDSLPHGGIWRGHQGFDDLFAAVSAHWFGFRVVYDASRFHDLEDGRVMCEGRVEGVRRATEQAVSMPIVSFFSFSDRGIAGLVHFYQDTGAIASAERSSRASIEQRLVRLEDETAIRETVTRYALSLDAADWDGLVTCFTEEAYFDFSSSSSWAPRRMSAESWVRDFAAANLSGFTRRQHLSVNHAIRITGDSALCTSYEFAQHYLATVDEPLTVEHGRYEHVLVRSSDGWLISSLTLRVWWTDGNPDLFALAARRSPN